jgi:hypothetical protein
VINQLILDKREALYKAEQLRRGADIDTGLAGDIRAASRLEAAGSFLRGGADIYRVLSG